MPQEPARGLSRGPPGLQRIPELPMLTVSRSHPRHTALPATHAWRRQSTSETRDGWMDGPLDGWMEAP